MMTRFFITTIVFTLDNVKRFQGRNLLTFTTIV